MPFLHTAACSIRAHSSQSRLNVLIYSLLYLIIVTSLSHFHTSSPDSATSRCAHGHAHPSSGGCGGRRKDNDRGDSPMAGGGGRAEGGGGEPYCPGSGREQSTNRWHHGCNGGRCRRTQGATGAPQDSLACTNSIDGKNAVYAQNSLMVCSVTPYKHEWTASDQVAKTGRFRAICRQNVKLMCCRR